MIDIKIFDKFRGVQVTQICSIHFDPLTKQPNLVVYLDKIKPFFDQSEKIYTNEFEILLSNKED